MRDQMGPIAAFKLATVVERLPKTVLENPPRNDGQNC